MVGAGASFAAAPRSVFETTTGIDFLLCHLHHLPLHRTEHRRYDVCSHWSVYLKSQIHGIRSDDNAVSGVSNCQPHKLYQRTRESKDDCHAHDVARDET